MNFHFWRGIQNSHRSKFRKLVRLLRKFGYHCVDGMLSNMEIIKSKISVDVLVEKNHKKARKNDLNTMQKLIFEQKLC